jgi:hypothetical protein
MINIYRSKDYDCVINFFYGRNFVERNEIVLKEKKVFGEVYRYAEPVEKGDYAFGGTILFTSNGIYPEFNTPIKLHDRRMKLER